ncbi:Efflux pump membrane transporter BepE [Usitatibacter rugosus]|uniref:Efflux pump membrane transporter n=1 Tax=Usitatibacter rugosus TaxID=2732067 RepID=A0A6M4GXW8_9PROT|nr:multidrug efflux RND transporter permease subunit [Usitatibacter rugosus]QJR12131.1 Efflux pump membrane transporter BepE [Usitatibacter rugosus]
MFSKFFIERPIFASVISIIIVLGGLGAMKALSIEQYPNLLPPVVSVSAFYSGASPDVISQTVAAPIEQQVNGVEDMIYLQSAASADGTMTLNVYFAIGTDPDQATINVNNRVQAALPVLPEEVKRQGVTVKKKSTSILLFASITSDNPAHDQVFLSNYVDLNILDEMKRIPGVGDATIMGAKDYAMRIWLRPDRLSQLGLTPTDVVNAIKEQNAQFAAGKIGAEPLNKPVEFTYTVTTKGRLEEPEEFAEIIIRSSSDGSRIRVKDVARVEIAAKDYSMQARVNGKPAALIGIYQQPGANALGVADKVYETLENAKARFPQGMRYDVPYDTTTFVRISVKEVVHTLFEAIVLVFLVVFLFLQNIRATLIPSIAVPISLIGTFAGMYALGFSINLLTLFGLVLAIGIVVDDAIVVLENVERLMKEEHLSPKDAAIKAMEEVSGPVVAIVLVLCAVFVPVAFMGGFTGQMYKQFAVTIAISVTISGIVALTLTPALCAILLKPGHHEPNRFFRAFNTGFEKLTQKFAGGVAFISRRVAIAFTLILVLLGCMFLLFKHVPGGLVPDEDQGYIMMASIMPDAASFSRADATIRGAEAVIGKFPETKYIIALPGYDLLSSTIRPNAGAMFITLKDWEERKGPGQDSFALAKRALAANGAVKEGLLFAFNPPPIIGLSTTGGVEAYLQSRTGAPSAAIGAEAQKVVEAAQKRPEFASITTTFKPTVPQVFLDVDREKAKAIGVPVNSIFDALQATFGSLYVNDFNKFGRTYKVQIQSEADFRANPEDIRNVFVRSNTGDMIPLNALVRTSKIPGPELVERFNVFPAAKIVATPAQGTSTGQVIAALEEVVNEVSTTDYSLAWTGSAFQEKQASGTAVFAFGFGIIMVFLILAAQYERWSLPFAVITAVPFALFGAVLAVWLRGLNNDVYFQVGLVTLVGLAAKNAILIVEFAVLKMEEGLPPGEAAIESARQRFRPIVMTSLAFILGCVPLVLSSGAGAASRHALGWPVIGGMLAATFIAIFFVPLFFRLIIGSGGKKSAPPPAAVPEAGHDD